MFSRSVASSPARLRVASALRIGFSLRFLPAFAALVVLAGGAATSSAQVLIDFDDRAAPDCAFAGSERIGAQWTGLGVTFSAGPGAQTGAIQDQAACAWPVSLNSPPNIVAYVAGIADLPLVMDFDPEVLAVSILATNWRSVDEITLTAYDGGGGVVASDTISTFGNVGPLQLLEVIGAGIVRAEITNTHFNDDVAFDDLRFQPVPRGACCFAEGSCLDLAPGDCAMQGGAGQGVGTDCAGTACPAPQACCFADGSCLDLEPADCAMQGGTAQGPGTDCLIAACLAPQACCLADGSCLDLDPVDCAMQGGSPQGPGTDCAGTACPAPQACCFADGSCLDLQPGDCAMQGGTAQGLGTDCLGAACVAPEACCFADGTCSDLDPADCSMLGGIAQGVGTDCAGTACPAPQACCFADGSCLDLEPADCALQGGSAQGAGTDCATAACPAPQACCFADGGCLDLDPAECATQGGNAQGPGTDCAGTACAAPGLPGWIPDGSSRAGEPLRVRKGTGLELLLTWALGCSPDATNSTVHEGAIGAWYSHESVLCDTAPSFTATTLNPGAGSRYLLIAAVTAEAEGSYGLDSFGVERPASSGLPCVSMQALGCP